MVRAAPARHERTLARRLAACAVALLACVHVPTDKEVLQGQTYYDLAVNSMKYGQFEDALENFQRSLGFNPNFADAHNGMGLVWWRKGRFELARKELEKAVELRPGFSDAWNNLGALSIETANLSAATVAFKTALADPLYKTPYIARSNLGWVYHLQGDDKEAMAQIREAILSEPMYCVGHKQLGSILEAMAKPVEAAAEWRAFARYCPEDPDAQLHLGKVLMAEGNDAGAAGAFLSCRLRAIKINPGHLLVRPCTDALAELPPMSPEETMRITNAIDPPPAGHTSTTIQDTDPAPGGHP